MSTIVDLERIKAALPGINIVRIIEEGFAAYSRDEVVVPPVGELIFEDPPGEVHIKYGYIKGDDFYVIKVASGFYQNPRIGLPSGDGLMLLFCQKTGSLKAVLLDNGHLTDVRTAAAGAVAARHLAPDPVERIGILGAGTQAKLQLRYLMEITSCRKATVWARDDRKAEDYLASFAGAELKIEIAQDPGQIAAECNLIVTTTPSTKPLLRADQIRPGTQITAVGSDAAHKIELDPEILGAADLVVVDSISQSQSRGEVFRAVTAGALHRDRVVELGSVIAGENRGRHQAGDITVCDLTGVAVQDIQIAKAVYQHLGREGEALS
jgi:ornithine cyclodeaminase